MVENLSRAKMINLRAPLAHAIEPLSGLPEVAGSYVLAWDKYVLVVGDFTAASLGAIDPPTHPMAEKVSRRRGR